MTFSNHFKQQQSTESEDLICFDDDTDLPTYSENTNRNRANSNSSNMLERAEFESFVRNWDDLDTATKSPDDFENFDTFKNVLLHPLLVAAGPNGFKLNELCKEWRKTEKHSLEEYADKFDYDSIEQMLENLDDIVEIETDREYNIPVYKGIKTENISHIMDEMEISDHNKLIKELKNKTRYGNRYNNPEFKLHAIEGKRKILDIVTKLDGENRRVYIEEIEQEYQKEYNTKLSNYEWMRLFQEDVKIHIFGKIFFEELDYKSERTPYGTQTIWIQLKKPYAQIKMDWERQKPVLEKEVAEIRKLEMNVLQNPGPSQAIKTSNSAINFLHGRKKSTPSLFQNNRSQHNTSVQPPFVRQTQGVQRSESLHNIVKAHVRREFPPGDLASKQSNTTNNSKNKNLEQKSSVETEDDEVIDLESSDGTYSEEDNEKTEKNKEEKLLDGQFIAGNKDKKINWTFRGEGISTSSSDDENSRLKQIPSSNSGVPTKTFNNNTAFSHTQIQEETAQHTENVRKKPQDERYTDYFDDDFLEEATRGVQNGLTYKVAKNLKPEEKLEIQETPKQPSLPTDSSDDESTLIFAQDGETKSPPKNLPAKPIKSPLIPTSSNAPPSRLPPNRHNNLSQKWNENEQYSPNLGRKNEEKIPRPRQRPESRFSENVPEANHSDHPRENDLPFAQIGIVNLPRGQNGVKNSRIPSKINENNKEISKIGQKQISQTIGSSQHQEISRHTQPGPSGSSSSFMPVQKRPDNEKPASSQSRAQEMPRLRPVQPQQQMPNCEQISEMLNDKQDESRVTITYAQSQSFGSPFGDVNQPRVRAPSARTIPYAQPYPSSPFRPYTPTHQNFQPAYPHEQNFYGQSHRGPYDHFPTAGYSPHPMGYDPHNTDRRRPNDLYGQRDLGFQDSRYFQENEMYQRDNMRNFQFGGENFWPERPGPSRPQSVAPSSYGPSEWDFGRPESRASVLTSVSRNRFDPDHYQDSPFSTHNFVTINNRYNLDEKEGKLAAVINTIVSGQYPNLLVADKLPHMVLGMMGPEQFIDPWKIWRKNWSNFIKKYCPQIAITEINKRLYLSWTE